MRWSLIGCVAALGLLALRGRADDPEPPGAVGLKALRGTWAVTKTTFGPRETKVPPGMDFLFDGDKLTRTFPARKGKAKGVEKLTYKVKLDTRKKPYRVTMTPDAGGRDHKWIFKIEKDQLTLATSRAGDFPPDFTGETVATMVMTKQVKEKK